jgi:hypothetical protein
VECANLQVFYINAQNNVHFGKWNVKVGLVGYKGCIIQVDQVLEWEKKKD